MRETELHVVIGAGIAGCTTAIMRSIAGYKVIILEKARSDNLQIYPICTEASSIVSENHSGAEYPYDSASITDCLDGRIANERFFPDFIYAGKAYTRTLASLSMVQAGDDISYRCKQSIETITMHYTQRIQENHDNCVFGDPDTICTEMRKEVDDVKDVATAFITPQRGQNPVYVAALLEAEIKRLGIEFRQGHEVTHIEKNPDGSMTVHFLDELGHQGMVNANQVCIAAAGQGFSLAKMLNPMLDLPEIYFALRQISLVSLPQGCHKTYTCLKLEDQYGGMFSPLNQECALIYYPPAAHIEVASMDRQSWEVPTSFLQKVNDGYIDEQRAQETLHKLQDFYPELKHAEILKSYLKIAVKTVDDSRIRRNVPVFQVIPGCTMIVLPKWTMAVINARRDLSFALDHSLRQDTFTQAQKETVLQEAIQYSLPVPESWKADFSTFLNVALQHSKNMHFPESIICPMNVDDIQSLKVGRANKGDELIAERRMENGYRNMLYSG